MPSSVLDKKSTRLNSSHTLISYAVFCLKKKHVDRKSTRLNSSHTLISYAVFCLKKKRVLHRRDARARRGRPRPVLRPRPTPPSRVPVFFFFIEAPPPEIPPLPPRRPLPI